MTDEEITKKLARDDAFYLYGSHNFIVRMYFYMQSGLSMLNNFHNIFLGLIALTITFKVGGGIIALLCIPAVIIFVFLGRYNVHTLSKRSDWLSMRFGTHYGIRQFDYIKGQHELLEEIRDLLKKIDQKNQ